MRSQQLQSQLELSVSKGIVSQITSDKIATGQASKTEIKEVLEDISESPDLQILRNWLLRI